MDTLEEKVRKARKVHRCELCRDRIEVGEKYSCQTNADDGTVYNYRCHLNCQKLAEAIAGRGERYPFDDEFLEELDFLIKNNRLTDKLNGKSNREKVAYIVGRYDMEEMKQQLR